MSVVLTPTVRALVVTVMALVVTQCVLSLAVSCVDTICDSNGPSSDGVCVAGKSSSDSSRKTAADV